MSTLIHFFLLLYCTATLNLRSHSDSIVVTSQTTGMLNTNCYLVFDSITNETALIDPGDNIDLLIEDIDENKLNLKYIFFTHCHPDHMYGIINMNLKQDFPKAKICFTKEGYEDMYEVVSKWQEVYPEYIVNMISSSSAAMEIFDMDYKKIGEPDIYVEDGQIFTLGEKQLKAFKTPGHARGSICLHIQNYLFTGDELMCGKVGTTTNSPISSFEKQVESVRKLYKNFSDKTIVYPGHEQATTIGKEKIGNNNISLTKAFQR